MPFTHDDVTAEVWEDAPNGERRYRAVNSALAAGLLVHYREASQELITSASFLEALSELRARAMLQAAGWCDTPMTWSHEKAGLSDMKAALCGLALDAYPDLESADEQEIEYAVAAVVFQNRMALALADGFEAAIALGEADDDFGARLMAGIAYCLAGSDGIGVHCITSSLVSIEHMDFGAIHLATSLLNAVYPVSDDVSGQVDTFARASEPVRVEDAARLERMRTLSEIVVDFYEELDPQCGYVLLGVVLDILEREMESGARPQEDYVPDLLMCLYGLVARDVTAARRRMGETPDGPIHNVQLVVELPDR